MHPTPPFDLPALLLEQADEPVWWAVRGGSYTANEPCNLLGIVLPEQITRLVKNRVYFCATPASASATKAGSTSRGPSQNRRVLRALGTSQTPTSHSSTGGCCER